nr:putative peroxidase [Aspergillus nidulans]
MLLKSIQNIVCGLVPTFFLFGSAAAELDFEQWHPAGLGDLRCGCPAMNSLANHGFINHNGSNITVNEVIPLMQEVFHLSEELATIVTGLAVLSADDPASGIFNLDMLNRHNIFEHDASLTRKDFYLGGDGHTIDQPTLDEFLSYFDGKEWIDLNDAAAARYARVLDSREKNPSFLYQDQQLITSYGETIKYFRTMVDPRSNKTSAEFVRILFTEERLPVRKGGSAREKRSVGSRWPAMSFSWRCAPQRSSLACRSTSVRLQSRPLTRCHGSGLPSGLPRTTRVSVRGISLSLSGGLRRRPFRFVLDRHLSF